MKHFLILLLLTGCLQKSIAWEFEKFKDKTRIARYTPKKNMHMMQFELIQSKLGNYGYLNTLNGELPDYVEVQFAVGSQTYRCEGRVFEGKQRLLLPEEATKTIVNALIEGQNVKVACDRYFLELEASGTSTRGSTLKAI